jgi:hypothetical protein
MVYFENFVAGTEPTERCPIHERVIANPIRALAALFSPKASAPLEPAVAHAPSAAIATESAPPPKVDAPPAPKKRGFWSRVFGGNDKKDDTNEKKPESRKSRP